MKKLTVVLTVLFSISLFVFTSCGPLQHFSLDDLLTYDWFEGTWEGTITGSQEYVFSNLTTKGQQYVDKYKEDFNKTEVDYSIKIEVVNENVICYYAEYNEETGESIEREKKENKKLMKISLSTPEGPSVNYYDIMPIYYSEYGHKLENNEPVYNFSDTFIALSSYFPEIDGGGLGSGSTEYDSRTNFSNTKIKIQSSSEEEGSFGDWVNEIEYGSCKYYYSVNIELERL